MNQTTKPISGISHNPDCTSINCVTLTSKFGEEIVRYKGTNVDKVQQIFSFNGNQYRQFAVCGDGDCLMHAIIHQFCQLSKKGFFEPLYQIDRYSTTNDKKPYHTALRWMLADHVQNNCEKFENFFVGTDGDDNDDEGMYPNIEMFVQQLLRVYII